MQERYDEAEEAFKRALAIEPDYEPARYNLALLSSGLRQKPSGMWLRKAGKGMNLKLGSKVVER
jgi:hypothetical protein